LVSESKRRTTVERTAYHEAGHVFVALSYRRPIVSATIERSENALGELVHRKAPRWFQPDTNLDARSEIWIHRTIQICLAGVIAEHIFTHKRMNHVGASHDYGVAAELALRVSLDGRDASAMLSWLRIRTELWLRGEYAWQRVDAVAKALLDRKTLRGYELKRVLKGVYETSLGQQPETAELQMLVEVRNNRTGTG
jgi:hypothetical protein